MDMLKVMDNMNEAVTVCDAEGKILYMNRQSCRTFARDGGADLVGKSLMDCHPEAAREKLEEMLKTHQPNCYTIEKGGVKKLIYQTPWFDGELFGGLIEFSFPIPLDMAHFVRNSSSLHSGAA